MRTANPAVFFLIAALVALNRTSFLDTPSHALASPLFEENHRIRFNMTRSEKIMHFQGHQA